MPEWIGMTLFLAAVTLSGAKINDDFGKRGLRGYATLLLMIIVYAAAVGTAYA